MNMHTCEIGRWPFNDDNGQNKSITNEKRSTESELSVCAHVPHRLKAHKSYRIITVTMLTLIRSSSPNQRSICAFHFLVWMTKQINSPLFPPFSSITVSPSF